MNINPNFPISIAQPANSSSSNSQSKKQPLSFLDQTLDPSLADSKKRALQIYSKQISEPLCSNLQNFSESRVSLNSSTSNSTTGIFQSSLGIKSEEGSVDDSDISGELFIDPDDFLLVIDKLHDDETPSGMCLGIVFMCLEELVKGTRDNLDEKIENLVCVLRNIDRDGIDLKQIERHSLETYLDDVDPNLRAFISEVRAFQCDQLMRDNLEKSKNVQKIDLFTGIYTKVDFEHYFKSLREFLKREAEEGNSIAFVLASANHVVSVGYNREDNKWIFIQFDELYQTKFNENSELVKNVILSFMNVSEDDYDDNLIDENFSACLSTTVYAAKENADSFNDKLQVWKNSNAFKEIHAPTHLKAELLDSNGSSWLSAASQSEDISLINTLLKLGAKIYINAKNSEGDTPLVQACKNGSLTIVKELLNNQADPNLGGADGCTPLWTACYHGQLETVRLLLGLGVEVDKRDSFGATPFWVACQDGRTEIVRLLMDHGADIEAADAKGVTPSQIAEAEKLTGIVEVIAERIKRKAIG